MNGAVGRLVRDRRVRFLAVGGVNTVAGYAVFALLVLTVGARVHYTVLTVVAYLLAVPLGFVLYRTFVWQVRGRVLRDLGRFYVVSVGALVANLLLLPPLVGWLGVPVLVAPVVPLVVTVLLSWFGHSRFSFRRPATIPQRGGGG